MNKVKVKIIHIVEGYVDNDGTQAYQVKMQVQFPNNPIGNVKGKYYYMNVLGEPKVKVGDVVEIDLDDFDTEVKEWIPGKDKDVVMLTYLEPKPE